MRRRCHFVLLSALFVLLAFPIGAASDGVTVTFLANEGVLVAGGGRGVLVDGCVREPYHEYGAVPDDAWARLLAGEAPFERLDVVLVSHAHRDHFQAEAARELLLARREAVLVVHREVAELLADGWGRWSEVEPRVVVVAPETDAPARWGDTGVAIELHRLPHGAAPGLPENLAHVVELGGRRVLHVGDAEASAAQLAASAIADVDVALLPYWYWLDGAWDAARLRLAGRLGTIAVHVPPGEVDTALAGVDDAPRIFRRPLDSARF